MSGLEGLFELLRQDRITRVCEKLLSSDPISKADREEIYQLLTGKKPPLRKVGRNKESFRDMQLACDYLTNVYEQNLLEPDVISKLYETYELSTLGTKQTTFNSALRRGIKQLECAMSKTHAKATNVLDDEGSNKLWSHESKRVLALIEKHNKRPRKINLRMSQNK